MVFDEISYKGLLVPIYQFLLVVPYNIKYPKIKNSK
jgi:hypothetical protein